MLNAETLDRAHTASRSAVVGRPLNGCGRVYVCLSSLDRATRKRVQDWAAARRVIFTGRAGHVSDGVYLGYDNATGVETAKAEAFAASLKADGVRCYVEHMGD